MKNGAFYLEVELAESVGEVGPEDGDVDVLCARLLVRRAAGSMTRSWIIGGGSIGRRSARGFCGMKPGAGRCGRTDLFHRRRTCVLALALV
jgi:hypothetical protein